LYSDYAVDSPEFLLNSKILQVLSKPIVKNFSICQNKTILQQLNDGIRYIDLRIVKNEKEELGSICHGLNGDFVISMLKQISEFVSENKKEIIFVDVKKVYGFNEKERMEWEKLFIEKCLSIFGGALCPADYSPTHTLEEIWDKGHQVIFFVPCVTSKGTELFWNMNSMNRSWANSPKESEVIEFIDNQISNHDEKLFHLSEFIVTPTKDTITSNLFSDLKSIVMEPNKQFIKSIKEKNNFNILCCDFYHEIEFVRICVEKNVKNK
jgi:hypothetical protein